MKKLFTLLTLLFTIVGGVSAQTVETYGWKKSDGTDNVAFGDVIKTYSSVGVTLSSSYSDWTGNQSVTEISDSYNCYYLALANSPTGLDTYYIQVSSENVIDKVEFYVSTNKTSGTNSYKGALVGWDTAVPGDKDAITKTATFTATGLKNAPTWVEVDLSEESLKSFRIYRKMGKTYIGGSSDLGDGQTLNIYGFRIWTKVSTTFAADKEYVSIASAYPLNCASLPTGLKAYQVLESGVTGSAVTMTEVTTAVPAGTGLILAGTAGTTYSIPVAASGTALSSNKLVGVTTDTAIGGDAVYHYILYNGQFCRAYSGTLSAGKAYLQLDAAPARENLDIVIDGFSTGIKNIKVGEEDSVYYNLQGQRVLYPTKGLYIVNGKKVILK